MRSASLVFSPVFFFLVAAGCSDNSLHDFPGDPVLTQVDDDDDAAGDPGVDDDDTGGPYDDGQPDDDDIGIDEPPPWRDDCPPEALEGVDFYGPDGEDEIYVLATGSTDAVGTLEVPIAGTYAVYDTAVYESGGSQTNETGYIRIRNASQPEGVSSIQNCGDEWIVQDLDNDGSPPGAFVYLGTFELTEGENEVTLSHFCPLFLAGECLDFHNGDPEAPSGCSGGGINSIHLSGDAICLIPR